MAKLKILVVDDECIIAKDIQNMLKELGYNESFIAFTGKEAIEKAEEIKPDLILMDIKLKEDMDGITSAEQICSCLNIPVIYISASTDKNTLQRVKKIEPFFFISKPVEESILQATIEKAHSAHIEGELGPRPQKSNLKLELQ